MKRVLITGASGFIGRHILPKLHDDGWVIYAITKQALNDEQGVRWINGDLLKLDSNTLLQSQILDAQPTHLLHLAWYGEHEKFWSSEENYQWVNASISLLRIFQLAGGHKAIIAGTCAEYDWSYGLCREYLTPCNPNSDYGACKHALHLLTRAWCDSKNLDLCWGRIFFPYGPGEPTSRLIPYLARSFLQGRSPQCRNSAAFRDFIHVEDVARAFNTLLKMDCKGVYNICSGEPIKIMDIVCKVGWYLGKRELLPEKESIERNEPMLLFGENKRLRELGWSPTVTMDEGLASYMNNIKGKIR